MMHSPAYARFVAKSIAPRRPGHVCKRDAACTGGARWGEDVGQLGGDGGGQLVGDVLGLPSMPQSYKYLGR